MARRCASAAILETLRDPRVVTMAPAAQTLWIRIVTAMQNSQISVLRFGSDIMNRTGIALFVAIAETEIETHLETLVDRALLRRDDDGAICCPMLEAQITRAEINRRNGKRGGRPRKDGAVPGQTHMLLAVEGGKVETEITESETARQSETAADGAARATTTYLGKEIKEVDSSEFRETGEAVLDVLGIDRAKSFMNYGIVRQWLADGGDKELILQVIGEIMARPHPPVIKNSLNYFNDPILAAIKARGPKKPQWEKQFNRDHALWDINGRQGPAPRLADYRGKAA